MASELVIESIVSEYTINDLGSKNLKKIQKESDKSTASIKKMEKEAKQAETAIGKLGKKFKGISKFGKGAVGKAQGAISSAGSGLGGLPLIGGLLAAAIGSIQSVKNQFVSGLAIRKELLGLSTDVQSAFNLKSKKAVNEFNKSLNFDTKFSNESQQTRLLSDLANVGIEKEQLQGGNMELLQTFAKSQGKDLDNVFEGIVKSGRGLDENQKLQSQNYIQMIQSQNPYEAKQGFDLFINMLKQSSGELEKYAKENQVVTSGIQSLSNSVESAQLAQDQYFVSGGRTKQAHAAFQTGMESEKIVKQMTMNIATGSGKVIDAANQEVGKMMTKGVDIYTRDLLNDMLAGTSLGKFLGVEKSADTPKRAGGGSVQAGKTYMVGENGPELHTPRNSGKIIPNNKLKGGNTTINMSPTFNITGGGNAMDVTRQIENYMDRLARSIEFQVNGNVTS